MRIAVWVTRAFGAEGAGGLPAPLALDGLVHREDVLTSRLAEIKPAVQRGVVLVNGTLAKFPGHVEAMTKATVQWGTNLLNSTLPKLLGHVQAVTKATVRWGTNLLNGTPPKFLGHVQAVTKATVRSGTNLLNGTLPKLLGHVQAVTKATVRWGTNLLNGTLPKLLGDREPPEALEPQRKPARSGRSCVRRFKEKIKLATARFSATLSKGALNTIETMQKRKSS